MNCQSIGTATSIPGMDQFLEHHRITQNALQLTLKSKFRYYNPFHLPRPIFGHDQKLGEENEKGVFHLNYPYKSKSFIFWDFFKIFIIEVHEVLSFTNKPVPTT